MLLATWNINGLRARLDFVLHWIRERHPDVVGFQELKLREDLFPFEEFEKEGYQAAVHGQKAWNGVAILSRNPIEVVLAGLPGQEDQGARFLRAQTGGIDFTTVYCPNGKALDHADYQTKLAWFDSLVRYFKSAPPADSGLLCGDFNICPQPIDSWNEEDLKGKIFHTAEERSRFQHLLNLGWKDLFREHHPETQSFSWWDYRAGAFYKNQGLRIDILLGTTTLLRRARRVEIDREYRKKKQGLTASDHAPVLLEID